MICNKCGNTNPDDAKFCASCGTMIEAENEVIQEISQETQKPQKNEEVQSAPSDPVKAKSRIEFEFKPQKKHIIIAATALAVIVAVIIAASIISNITKNNRFLDYSDYITSAYDPDADFTHIIINGEVLKNGIKGCAEKKCSSITGDVAVFSVDESELYVVANEKISKISEDAKNIQLSFDGSTVGFVDSDSTLYTVKVSNKKIKKIADNVSGYNKYNSSGFRFSPDGNTIIYITYNDKDEFQSYINVKGKVTELDDFLGFFTSNGGKTIIGEGSNGSLRSYNLKKGTTEKISNDFSQISFNADYTEMIFSASTGVYMSVKGKEKTKLGTFSDIMVISPDYCDSPNGYCEPVKSFVNTMLVYGEDGSYQMGYINKKHELITAVENLGKQPESFYVSNDYDNFYYISNGDLRVAKRSDKFETTKLADDVESYKVSSNEKKIYFVDSDSTLYCLSKGNKRSICDDVAPISLEISENDTCFFISDVYKSSGTLYRCKNGKTKERLADDISAVNAYPDFIFCTTPIGSYEEKYCLDIYVSTNYKKMSKILEDVSLLSSRFFEDD